MTGPFGFDNVGGGRKSSTNVSAVDNSLTDNRRNENIFGDRVDGNLTTTDIRQDTSIDQDFDNSFRSDGVFLSEGAVFESVDPELTESVIAANSSALQRALEFGSTVTEASLAAGRDNFTSAADFARAGVAAAEPSIATNETLRQIGIAFAAAIGLWALARAIR